MECNVGGGCDRSERKMWGEDNVTQALKKYRGREAILKLLGLTFPIEGMHLRWDS